ncbi:metallophosphoesterase [Bernardetia sp.]|uniref:metallophosphoesterase n=1 Tax=Bernardetia sp. TaxID=1937974 RepID=UPI0025BB498E|nr:metallophosphoesterase [Bernardetia sp.]
MKIIKDYLIILILPFLYSCKSVRVEPIPNFSINYGKEDIEKTIFLLGDAGNSDSLTPIFISLKKEIEQNPFSTLIFLGDNIYPYGLIPEEKIKNNPKLMLERKEAEIHINSQLKIVENHKKENVIFVAGNHDWGHEKKLSFIKEEQNYITKKGYHYLPTSGCSTPEILHLSENTLLICLDTQYLIQKQKNSNCELETNQEIYTRLDSIIVANQEKKIIVAAHHLLESESSHGGKFPLRPHLFPSVDLKKKLYIPLPFLGTAYVLMRKAGFSEQDISNSRYRDVKKSLSAIFEKHSNLVYACGHEHTLQYHKFNLESENKNVWRQVNSGAGSKKTFINQNYKKDKKAFFAYADYGFARLDYLKNGKTVVYYYNQNGQVLYSDAW